MQFDCIYFSDEFKDLLAQYFMGLEHNGTAYECLRCVRSICSFAQKDFLDLTRKDVDSYVLHEIREKKLKQRTVSTRFYRFVPLARFIDASIPGYGLESVFTSIRMPCDTIDQTVEKIRKKMVSRQDYESLLSAAEAAGDEMAVLIFALAYEYALYASEVCDLRIDQIHGQSDGTKVLYLYNDSYHSDRNVILKKDFGERLCAYAERQKKRELPFVFLNKYGNQLTLRNLNLLFRKYCRMSKIGGDVAFRDLRTTCVISMFGSDSPNAIGEKTNLRDARLTQYSTAYKSMGGIRKTDDDDGGAK